MGICAISSVRGLHNTRSPSRGPNGTGASRPRGLASWCDDLTVRHGHDDGNPLAFLFPFPVDSAFTSSFPHYVVILDP